MFYNASKGGVDTFDMMCAQSDIGRKTVRWPMCVFFGLDNMVVNNSFIIYYHTAKTEGRKVSKADFLQDLAYSLCKPFALERLEKHGRYLSDELKDKIKTTFVQTPQGAVAADPAEEPFTGWKKGVTKKSVPLTTVQLQNTVDLIFAMVKNVITSLSAATTQFCYAKIVMKR